MTTQPTAARPEPPTTRPSTADAPTRPAAGTTLVTAGSGKTGRRVVARLERLGVPVRAASRSTSPAFDWHDPSTWPAALDGIDAAYLCYVPDLAVPGATQTLEAVVDEAQRAGVRRVVLLSGRGEVEAQRAERVVQRDGLAWTVVRSAWFLQNLSEGFFAEAVAAGELALPVGDVREPWVDLEDVADVVVAALTQEGHAGRTYEVTGPRLLTFDDLAAEITRGVGQPVRFRRSTLAELQADLRPYGDGLVELMTYLVTEVLDGRNASLAHGVHEALGRAPHDVSEYVRAAAATGTWHRP
ncbi:MULTISPECIES: SDR family oxidoreductase [unclassified Actinotalea]|uniref:SDR family oxidoreductase n=1 Tax=unclassified Actinotalea TaxID=2638618 RepID=UPI0015F5EC43|nr:MULTISPECIES: NAD(P)H-binding protein [unclassified Actinotalea]